MNVENYIEWLLFVYTKISYENMALRQIGLMSPNIEIKQL